MQKLMLLLAVACALIAGCAVGPAGSRVSLEIRLATDEPTAGFRPAHVAGTRHQVYLSPVVELTEAGIKEAVVVRTRRGPAVGLELGWSAARHLASVTKKHVGDQSATWYLAFIVDGSIVSAALIKGKTGRRMIVAGDFSEKEAQELAAALSGRPPPRVMTPIRPRAEPRR